MIFQVLSEAQLRWWVGPCDKIYSGITTWTNIFKYDLNKYIQIQVQQIYSNTNWTNIFKYKLNKYVQIQIEQISSNTIEQIYSNTSWTNIFRYYNLNKAPVVHNSVAFIGIQIFPQFLSNTANPPQVVIRMLVEKELGDAEQWLKGVRE